MYAVESVYHKVIQFTFKVVLSAYQKVQITKLCSPADELLTYVHYISIGSNRKL